eukprot:2682453-Pyramimonas_sp.AAC.1
MSQKRQILEILEHHNEHLNFKVAATPMEKDLNLPKDTHHSGREAPLSSPYRPAAMDIKMHSP